MTEGHSEPANSNRIPWIRILLALVYIGLGIGFGVYEVNAHKFLNRGHLAEESQKYQTAGMCYMVVIENYPFSFAVIEAKNGLRGIEPALEDSPIPDRLGTSWLEHAGGERFNPYSMSWLPFAGNSLSLILLSLIFLTRLRRRGLAVFVFLWMCAASLCLAAQLAWYGWVDQPELARAAEMCFSSPPLAYIATYILFLATVLLSLSRPRQAVAKQTSDPEDEDVAPSHHSSHDRLHSREGTPTSQPIKASPRQRHSSSSSTEEVHMAEKQVVVVKHKHGCCCSCLVIVLILAIGLPVLIFVFKVAFLVAIFESISGG